MQSPKQKGFTLIELLVVMAVIVILSALVLSLISFVQRKAARTKATGEVHALSTAMESYKADNGIYPNDADVSTAGTYAKGATDNLDARTMGNPTAATYSKASAVLYRALSGDRNGDRTVNSTDQGYDLTGNGGMNPPLGAIPQAYYTFTSGQLLPAGGKGVVTGISDPFGYSYGYSTAYQGDIAVNNLTNTTTAPTHGYSATFDLWSTGATISTTTVQLNTNQPAWIANWLSNP